MGLRSKQKRGWRHKTTIAVSLYCPCCSCNCASDWGARWVTITRAQTRGENRKKMQRQWPHNLHFWVCVYFINFWEMTLPSKRSRSKLDGFGRLALSKANTLSEGVPSVSRRWEICLLQPAVTSDAHIMPSPPWRNMTGPLTVRLTAVFKDMGSCYLLLFPSDDHTPSGAASTQMSKNYK